MQKYPTLDGSKQYKTKQINRNGLANETLSTVMMHYLNLISF